MPEIHVPKLDDHDVEIETVAAETTAPDATAGAAATATTPAHRPRGRSVLKIALEVALIATGVFLGLAGEQWRENARHRELAAQSLHRFRSEVATNREAVARVVAYHAATLEAIEQYFAEEPKARHPDAVTIRGLQPVAFEHTAWDLALTTQSLSYIDQDLAFALARAYNVQDGYGELSRGVLNAMYVKPPNQDLEGFLHAAQMYFADITLFEPQLLRLYDELLPRIDGALNGASTARATH